jgi:hypothetical protein
MPAALVVRAADRGDLTWILMAANGRPLARSAAAFRSSEALAAAWRELVAERAELSIRLARDGAGPDWWWSATLPVRGAAAVRGTRVPGTGVVVARSARGYLRPDQCRGGASGFVSALAGFARRPR